MKSLDKLLKELHLKSKNSKVSTQLSDKSLEAIITLILNELIESSKDETEKLWLRTFSPLIILLAKQGMAYLEAGLFHLQRMEIEKLLSSALRAASEEDRERIIKNIAGGAYIAAINQYEDAETAKDVITSILSVLISKLILAL